MCVIMFWKPGEWGWWGGGYACVCVHLCASDTWVLCGIHSRIHPRACCITVVSMALHVAPLAQGLLKQIILALTAIPN